MSASERRRRQRLADRQPRPLPLPQPLWQIPSQPPQIRLGDFGFQSSAVDGWPTGGLGFRLRRRPSVPPRLRPRLP
ncbi:MAG: hypothetical protein ABUT39_25215 [Acidobacteriota bacterium]